MAFFAKLNSVEIYCFTLLGFRGKLFVFNKKYKKSAFKVNFFLINHVHFMQN